MITGQVVYASGFLLWWFKQEIAKSDLSFAMKEAFKEVAFKGWEASIHYCADQLDGRSV